MSLSEKSRSSLYLGLRAVIDDQEAISEMLAHFPVRDVDEPATRDHLRAEAAILDKKMTEGFAVEVAARSALEHRMVEGFACAAVELAALEKRMVEGFAALEQRMTEGFAHAAAERAALDQRVMAAQTQLASDLSAEMRRWFLASMTLMVAVAGVVVALGS